MPMSINRKNKIVAEILDRAARDAAFRASCWRTLPPLWPATA